MFSIIATLYNEILYRPLLNALIAIYNFVPGANLGIAVILLTILIRVILFPLFHKSTRNQTILQKIQPEIKEVSEKYKDNKEEQVKRIMEIYQNNKINPFSGIFLLLIQIPILIALFRVFYLGFGPEVLDYLYSFIARPNEIDPSFFSLINLHDKSIIMVSLAAVVQYWQGKLSLPKTKSNNPVASIGKNMMIAMSVMSFFVLMSLPSVMSLYWITTSLFSIAQQRIINNSLRKDE